MHTSPAAQVSDCGNLLSGAGFTIPTVDQDTLEVGWGLPSFELLAALY